MGQQEPPKIQQGYIPNLAPGKEGPPTMIQGLTVWGTALLRRTWAGAGRRQAGHEPWQQRLRATRAVLRGVCLGGPGK